MFPLLPRVRRLGGGGGSLPWSLPGVRHGGLSQYATTNIGGSNVILKNPKYKYCGPAFEVEVKQLSLFTKYICLCPY